MLPNEAFERLASMVTVIHGGYVNLNNASPDVLEMLALIDGYDESFIFDGLEDPYLKELPDGAETSSSVEVELLRIVVSLNRGNVPFTISALVEPNFSSQASGEGTTNQSPRNSPQTSSSDAPKTGTSEEQEAPSATLFASCS